MDKIVTVVLQWKMMLCFLCDIGKLSVGSNNQH